MQLLADLRLYPASDALQWAASAQLDGALTFQRNRRTLRLMFERGRIVGCESSRPHESFRQHLYSQGWVDRLDLAAIDQMDEPEDTATKLIQLGVMSERQARELVAAHTLDLACSAVGWPDGVVFAKSASLRPSLAPYAQPLDTVFAALEAARRMDELDKIRESVPHDNVRLGTGEVGARPNQERRSPAEQRLLESFDGSQTVGELYRVVGGCRYNFMRNLELLLDDGILACVEEGTAPEPPAPNRFNLLDVLLDNQTDRRQLA